MTASEEPLGQSGQSADIFHADRHARDAVPIRAETYMLGTRGRDRVIEMVE